MINSNFLEVISRLMFCFLGQKFLLNISFLTNRENYSCRRDFWSKGVLSSFNILYIAEKSLVKRVYDFVYEFQSNKSKELLLSHRVSIASLCCSHTRRTWARDKSRDEYQKRDECRADANAEQRRRPSWDECRDERWISSRGRETEAEAETTKTGRVPSDEREMREPELAGEDRYRSALSARGNDCHARAKGADRGAHLALELLELAALEALDVRL